MPIPARTNLLLKIKHRWFFEYILIAKKKKKRGAGANLRFSLKSNPGDPKKKKNLSGTTLFFTQVLLQRADTRPSVFLQLDVVADSHRCLLTVGDTVNSDRLQVDTEF